MDRRRTGRSLFPRGPGLGFKASCFLVLGISLWMCDTRGLLATAQIRATIATALAPMHWFAALPSGIDSATVRLRTVESLVRENRTLKDQLLYDQARLLKFEALEAENRRIRQLLTSATALHERILIAEIIGTAQEPYRRQLTINKGSKDGVYTGQALVDAYGVMGQITQTNPSTATALLVSDPDHGIPVELTRTGLQTIARGSPDGLNLILPYLPGNADIKVGDVLVSSALGGRFPAGYPVGVVFDVRRASGVHLMQASAYPSARLDQGRHALLVWNDPAAKQPPEAPAAISTDAAPTENTGTTKPPTGAAKPAAGTVPSPAPRAAPNTSSTKPQATPPTGASTAPVVPAITAPAPRPSATSTPAEALANRVNAIVPLPTAKPNTESEFAE